MGLLTSIAVREHSSLFLKTQFLSLQPSRYLAAKSVCQGIDILVKLIDSAKGTVAAGSKETERNPKGDHVPMLALHELKRAYGWAKQFDSKLRLLRPLKILTHYAGKSWTERGGLDLDLRVEN